MWDFCIRVISGVATFCYSCRTWVWCTSLPQHQKRCPPTKKERKGNIPLCPRKESSHCFWLHLALRFSAAPLWFMHVIIRKCKRIIACDVLGNFMDIVVFMFALSNKICIEYIIPYLADLSTLHPSRAANFSIGILILPRGFLSSIVFIAPSFLTQGSFYLQIIILNTLSFFLALSSHHVESFLLRPTCSLFNVPFLKCVTFSMSVNVFALNT